ncbi:Elongation factor 2 [Fusarium oxysporum f. sp. albedinis]|nr:Elongation factor 2 [Fusarium oxysporum f. sp. albedinis]
MTKGLQQADPAERYTSICPCTHRRHHTLSTYLEQAQIAICPRFQDYDLQLREDYVQVHKRGCHNCHSFSKFFTRRRFP